MIAGVTMAARKVTISVEASLLVKVDRLARRAKQSRSEWLAAAAERTIRQMKLRSAISAARGKPSGACRTSRVWWTHSWRH